MTSSAHGNDAILGSSDAIVMVLLRRKPIRALAKLENYLHFLLTEIM